MYIYLANLATCDIFTLLAGQAESFSRGGPLCWIVLKRCTKLARNLLLKICANLIEFLKEIIFSPSFLERHRRSPRDFVRERLLPFHNMIFFLTNLIKGSVQDELDYFFKAIHGKDIAERNVTKSAFTKARRKLRHQAFIELGQSLISFFYDHFPYRRWQEFRVLTIDGSTLPVPKTEEAALHFGIWHSKGGDHCPMARISHLFDALNGITIDALISSKDKGERILAAEHMKHLSPGDLVLLDRGYPAFWLFALILSKGAHFCSRIQEGHWNVVQDFHRSGCREKIVTIHPSPSSLEKCQELHLSNAPFQVRLMRVELENGQTEILVTSLMDSHRYPHEIFKDLYHLRWRAEENYKTAKHRVQIGNFSGKTVESIYQDFYAKTFTMNLVAALSHPAQTLVTENSKAKIHTYKINETQALSKIKDSIVLLFNQENIFDLLRKLFNLFIRSIEPVRPGRNYPRKHKPMGGGCYVSYKPAR